MLKSGVYEQIITQMIDQYITSEAGMQLYDFEVDNIDFAIHPGGRMFIELHSIFVRGSTALLDAVGKTINKIGNVQKHTAEDERAEHVMFIITTDGMENASREFSDEKVRRMIEHQKNKYGWEFIFLGANIDAIATAERFGIGEDRATNYHADSEGTLLNYEVISETVSCLRASRPISENWKERIDEDFRKRGGKR